MSRVTEKTSGSNVLHVFVTSSCAFGNNLEGQVSHRRSCPAVFVTFREDIDKLNHLINLRGEDMGVCVIIDCDCPNCWGTWDDVRREPLGWLPLLDLGVMGLLVGVSIQAYSTRDCVLTSTARHRRSPNEGGLVDSRSSPIPGPRSELSFLEQCKDDVMGIVYITITWAVLGEAVDCRDESASFIKCDILPDVRGLHSQRPICVEDLALVPFNVSVNNKDCILPRAWNSCGEGWGGKKRNYNEEGGWEKHDYDI